MAEFNTDEVRWRYRRKLGLRERRGSRHYVYEIVSPGGTYIGRTVLSHGRAAIGRPLSLDPPVGSGGGILRGVCGAGRAASAGVGACGAGV